MSEKDTLLDGFNARILGCYVSISGELKRIDSLTKYIATNGNKVYYRVVNEFVILFDFDAIQGDTVHSAVEEFPIDMGCYSDFSSGIIQYSYVIDSISTIIIDGTELKIQYVTVISPISGPTWQFYNPIIERIGNKELGSFWWGEGEACILEDNGFLRCYHDSDITYRSPIFDEDLACDYTIIPELEIDNTLNVYPNPANNVIIIPSESINIEIYNSLGTKFPFEINAGEIDIHEFESGIYFLIFQSNGILKHSTFLIIN
ncbi:MAG TPA: T9SS type A sorting domain-containing protein [Saprospiraceae bacterium]|nr:T9SS type A sorting domain-containing protein [Saprospiraceae bacterium]